MIARGSAAMSEHGGLGLAIELATQYRDACQTALAAARRSVLQDQEQRNQLQAYADDKDRRWLEAGNTQFSAELVKHHYQFMERLQQAVGMQSGVIKNAEAAAARAASALMDAEVRLAALKEVLQVRTRAREALLNKREQKQTDEFATQQYIRRRTAFEKGESL
ncbi:MAG: flagellar export protein FliJ [Burkholderiales bacterium PBB4]|nr:MAG: flagellar export protein FliJ [Burkholderiales bacterium PBB4]